MPRRGVCSPPGPELLGAVTSHGPFRESYRPSRKSRGSAEAIGPATAEAAVSAQRVRGVVSSAAGAAAVLQRGLPGGSQGVVASEGAADLPGDHGGPAETEGPKPALPGAGAEPPTTRARSSWRGSEGNHSRRFFSNIAATGQAARRDSRASGEVPCNASVRTRAGVRWSGSKSGSGAGNGLASSSGNIDPPRKSP